MAIFRQFDSLVIKDYVTDVFMFAPHGHTYYELIYIFKGNGIHTLNTTCSEYSAGDLFLISPDDHHHFEVRQSTRFVVIKFTDDYFNNIQATNTLKDIVPQVMMRMQALKEIKLSFDQKSALSLNSAIQNITAYKDADHLGTSLYVYFQLLSIFGLIRETIYTSENLQNTGKIDNQHLLSYIHENIYDPHKCQVQKIAVHFNISESYFGAYFKRTFGINYRDYLNNYRTTLIEKRIESGRMNMKQIASEFGFSDESHFSNYFKKQRKLRPKDYKGAKSPTLL